MPRLFPLKPKGPPKPPKTAQAKQDSATFITLSCPFPSCGHSFTVAAAEAKKIKLCPNCIRPLKKPGRSSSRSGELAPVGSLIKPKLLKQIKGPTALQRRLIDTAADQQEPENPLYMHTVFCQTSLPYRDPGDDVREWRRTNGNLVLKVIAGEVVDPNTGEDVLLNLPFGAKARTILMHMNQRALVTGRAAVEMEDSLTRFVSRVLQLDPHGRNMRMVKEQLARLAASTMRLAILKDGRTLMVNSQIVTAFEIWFPKDDRQRVLWPTIIQFSSEYFESLQAHAVPLDEAHISALCHSAMALDIYAWLAQRLHRIPPGKPITISWIALHNQFGQGYNPDRVDKFRQVFRVALKEVLTVYRSARVEEGKRQQARVYMSGGHPIVREPALVGLTLHNSPPPVRKLLK